MESSESDRDIFNRSGKIQRTPPVGSKTQNEEMRVEKERESKRDRNESNEGEVEGDQQMKKMRVIQRMKKGEQGASYSDTEITQRRMESEIKKREEKLKRQEEEKKEAKKKEEEEMKAKRREEMMGLQTQKRDLEKIKDSGEVFSTRIKNIVKFCDTINQAVCKESAGKISVTRADQQVVKTSVMELQKEVIDVLLKQVELLEENTRLRANKVTPKRVAPIRVSTEMGMERVNADVDIERWKFVRKEVKGRVKG